ncbi:hypothetical protein ROZALSC1DRAFT_28141 [Rozella allomycis CSF55]|uniref:Uncharacterized protein n=1 Tax=Rozella allomycis (strain CSF55) TaxID=988480 RepID=A0A075AR35_ROZAC|nr:hypothetical protein O9G_004557 [Rozella allomycis CSF55]RKP20363.1 hypothetical protein ROZALSC1DRAFT_28141 [Rozella allomycis CSF55]|eukprot:EPZ32605.1 hypothetical protein O9G_004557 [Rozella allomycis CSF55]
MFMRNNFVIFNSYKIIKENSEHVSPMCLRLKKHEILWKSIIEKYPSFPIADQTVLKYLQGEHSNAELLFALSETRNVTLSENEYFDSIKSFGKRLVLFKGINLQEKDPRDLGSLCRTSVALGFDGIIWQLPFSINFLDSETLTDFVFPLNFRCIKGSSGALMRIPLLLIGNDVNIEHSLRMKGWKVLESRNPFTCIPEKGRHKTVVSIGEYGDKSEEILFNIHQTGFLNKVSMNI